MRIEYDEVARRCYIYFSEIGPEAVKRTIEVDEDTYLDFDWANKLVGIDIPDDKVPDELLNQIADVGEVT